MAIRQNRLKLEYEDLKKYKQFKVKIDPNNSNVWFVRFKGADKTLYEKEKFTLRFEFDERYVINIFLTINYKLYSQLKDQQSHLLKIYLLIPMSFQMDLFAYLFWKQIGHHY